MNDVVFWGRDNKVENFCQFLSTFLSNDCGDLNAQGNFCQPSCLRHQSTLIPNSQTSVDLKIFDLNTFLGFLLTQPHHVKLLFFWRQNLNLYLAFNPFDRSALSFLLLETCENNFKIQFEFFD
jgi:hypothetical protein